MQHAVIVGLSAVVLIATSGGPTLAQVYQSLDEIDTLTAAGAEA